MSILEFAINLISSPPGILLYYLVLLFTLEAAIGLCWGEWRRSRNARYRDFALGFGGILVAKLLVAGAEGLRLLGWLPAPVSQAVLPPLASAGETVALVFLCWGLVPSEFKIRQTKYGLLGGALAVTAGLYLISAVVWASQVNAGETVAYVRHWLGQLGLLWPALLFAALGAVYVWQGGRRRALMAAALIILALGRVLEAAALYPPGLAVPTSPLWEHASNLIAWPLFVVIIYQTTILRLYYYNQSLQNLNQASQSQVRDLFFLLETLKSTTASLDAQMTYRQVVENIALAMRADHCALAMRVPNDTQHLRIVATYDTQARERDMPDVIVDLRRHKVFEMAVMRERQIMIERLSTDPQVQDLYAQLRVNRSGPVLFQPIAMGSRVLGVLLLAKDAGRVFTTEERNFCKNLTKQIATALENVRVYAVSRQQVQLATDLQEMTQALGASLDVKPTLDAVLVLAQRKIGYDMAEVSLLDAQGRVTLLRGAHERVYGRAGAGEPLPPGPSRWLLENRQPLLLAQVTDPPAPRPDWPDTPVTSFLGAPLQHGESVRGVIELARSGPQPFDDQDLGLLTHLATVATEALDRATTYGALGQQLTRSHAETRALQRSLAAWQTPVALTERLAIILEQALVVTQSHAGTLVILSEQEGEGLAVQLFQGLAPAQEAHWRRWGVAGSALMRAIRQDQAATIADVTSLPEFRPLAPEGRAQLVVPLAVRPSGGIILEHNQPNAYTPADLHMVTALVDVIAAVWAQEQLQAQLADRDSRGSPQAEERIRALEQANQALQKQLDRLEHLTAIRRQLTTSADLEASLSRALPLVLETADLPFSGATVLIFEAATNSLVPQVTVGYRARPFKLDEGLAWQCASQHQAIQVAQVDGSAVALPLQVAQDFLGVLLLVATGRRHFDPDEVAYLSAIAQEIAQAVAHSYLYQNLEQQSDQLAKLLLSREGDMGQLRPMLDSMPVGVLLADPGGAVTQHNDLAPRILENSGRLIGQNIHALCGLTNAEGELVPQAAPLLDFEAVWQHLELTEHVAELSLAPILAADGALLGYLAVIRDVSDESRRARLRTEFLSTVSHQLYGPLTSISGYQNLVLEGDAGPLTAEAREYLQVAQDNCVRLTRLLDRLLDLTVLERAALPVKTTPVPLTEVLAPVLVDYQEALTHKNLELAIRIPADLPPLQANTQRLAQVLSALLANAIDYNEPGGDVEIAAQVVEGMIQIDVTDTGIGIAPDDQAHVFSQFFRTTGAEYLRPQGTGLSLALSKALIELQGGRIWFHSDGQPGHGSTFSFTLPIASVVDESRTIAALAGLTRRPQKILVVDDEPDIARLVAYYLEQSGYQVEQAADGHAALAQAHRARPDLILTDISMPGLDGYALIQQLRADPATATIPVVVMSVLPSDARGLRLGTVGYVNKPLNRQQLLETVDSALVRVEQMLLVSRDEPFLDELGRLLDARGYRVLVAHDERQVRAYAGHQDLKLALLDKRAANGLGAVGDLILDWLGQYPKVPPVVVLVDAKDPALEEYLLVQGANAVLVNPTDREALAHQLETLTVVASYYRDLVQATGDDDPYLRWRAMEALAQAPADEVLGYLVDALRDPNAYVRLNTIDILDRMSDNRIALPVVGCLADPDPRVVARAAEVLGKVGDTRAVETLIARLSHDEAAVRIKIVEALGLLGDTRALSSLLNTLSDQDTRVRWNAVYALGRLGSLEVIDALRRALQQDPDPGVRSRAAVALSMVTRHKDLDTPVAEAVIETLIAALQDSSKDVQERAVEALGMVGDERAIFPLRRLSTEQQRQSSAMLPELARLAVRQIRERSRKRGRQWGDDAALLDQEDNAPAGAASSAEQS